MVKYNLGRLLLFWAFTFLILAVIAAAYGMVNGSGSAARISIILFVVFLVLMTAFFLTGRRPAA